MAKAAAEAIGAERVGMRLSPYSTFNDLSPHADVQVTYAALARELRGLVYLHVIENRDPGFAATARAIRAAFAGTVILNGGFDRSRAEAALRAGQAELVAFGVPLHRQSRFGPAHAAGHAARSAQSGELLHAGCGRLCGLSSAAGPRGSRGARLMMRMFEGAFCRRRASTGLVLAHPARTSDGSRVAGSAAGGQGLAPVSASR
jgi:hypothetical protein